MLRSRRRPSRPSARIRSAAEPLERRTLLAAVPATFMSGESLATEGQPYRLNLSTLPTNTTPVSWSVNWGDGKTEVVTGTDVKPTHVYADGPAHFVGTASVLDGVNAVPLGAGNLDDAFGLDGMRLQRVAPSGAVSRRMLRQRFGDYG